MVTDQGMLRYLATPICTATHFCRMHATMPPTVDNGHGNSSIVGKLKASPQTDIEVSHNHGVDNIIVDMTINSGD